MSYSFTWVTFVTLICLIGLISFSKNVRWVEYILVFINFLYESKEIVIGYVVMVEYGVLGELVVSTSLLLDQLLRGEAFFEITIF